jgi:hypothetical protein
VVNLLHTVPTDSRNKPARIDDMTTTTTNFRCINDRYDADGSTLYESVEDFQAMCVASFGAPADLREDGGVWRDETGAAVLEQA